MGSWRRFVSVAVEDKVVDVLMQLKFQQSRVRTGSSSTECWTSQLRTERVRAVQTVQETLLRVDVPVIGAEVRIQFPQIQSILGLADIPDVHQNTVEIPQPQFLVVWEVVDMPVYVQRQVPSSWTNFLFF